MSATLTLMEPAVKVKRFEVLLERHPPRCAASQRAAAAAQTLRRQRKFLLVVQ